MKFRVIRLLTTVFAALSLAGCVKEDLSSCTGLTINFRYTLNNKNIDLVSAQVKDIRLYVFDDNGVLYDIVRVSGAELKSAPKKDIKLTTGRYDIIVWGGSSEDMMGGGFMDAEMIDAANHNYTNPVKIGQTTVDKFRMMLTYNLLPDEIPGEIAPQTDEFDDLFFGEIMNLNYVQGRKQTVTINLIKNTNTLKIKVKGINYLTTRATSPINVFVLGKNGCYKAHNAIDQYARTLRYETPFKSLDANKLEVDVKLLRLDIDRHTTVTTPTADPILLYIQDAATGEDLIAPLDVVTTILQAKDASGNYIYQNQTDLDREDEYPIEISISADLSVSIKVHNWTIGSLDPGIE